MRRKRIAVDLFAGAGGLSLGLRQAGFRVGAAVEIDPLAAETYRTNHAKTLLLQADISTVSPIELLRALGLRRGELDLLAGCAPCQGFSSLRTKNGRHQPEDERNDLILEFVRFASVMQPKAILIENVPGLVNDSRFKSLVAGLERLGYPAASGYRILDAAHFGVAQHRRRLVVMVAKRSAVPFALSSGEARTVKDAIGTLAPPGGTGDALHDVTENRSDRVRNIIASIPPDGGSRSSLPDSLRLACHEAVDGFKDVYGRMRWDQPAPTITSGCYNPSKGRFLHPVQNRTVTLREAALLQGFPPDYAFSMTRGKTGAALLIGNAVPPPFARAQARQLLRHSSRIHG